MAKYLCHAHKLRVGIQVKDNMFVASAQPAILRRFTALMLESNVLTFQLTDNGMCTYNKIHSPGITNKAQLLEFVTNHKAQ